MSVQLESGSFKGTREQLRRQVAVAVGNGSFQGMIQAIAIVSPSLAQKTGNFRSAFSRVALEYIQQQMGQTQIRIDVDEIADAMVAILPYAEYHIDGKPHHPGDTTPYRDPTTPGTAPLDTDELRRVTEREIKKAVFDNFRAAGLEFLINR